MFQLNRTIDDATLDNHLCNLSAEDKLQFHTQEEGRAVSRDRQSVMQLSRSRLLVELGRIEEAKEVREKVDKDFRHEVFGDGGKVSPKFLWRQEKLEMLLKSLIKDRTRKWGSDSVLNWFVNSDDASTALRRIKREE